MVKYKYDSICIITETSNDSVIMQKLLFELGLTWASGHKVVMNTEIGYTEIMALDVSLKSKKFTYGHYDNIYERFDIYDEDPKKYYITDLANIKSIIKYGSILPIYEPRIIKKI